jgi:hypothetical protein
VLDLNEQKAGRIASRGAACLFLGLIPHPGLNQALEAACRHGFIFPLLPVPAPDILAPIQLTYMFRFPGGGMAAKSKKVCVKSKVWLEDREGRIIFGLGRMRILRAIDRCGSLNAAAKDLKMSYRAVWGKIKVTEDALGKPLLVKSQG